MILDTLIPRVTMQMTGVEDNLALISMRDVLREFLTQTKLWKATLTLDAVAETSAYALDTSTQVGAGESPVVHRIEEVKLNGATVHATGYYLRSSDGYLVFETGYIPNEDLTDGIVVKVRLIPTWDGIDFPQFIVETYVDAIVQGTVSKLQKIPGRPYTDLGASRENRQIYRQGIVQARSDLDSEGTERSGNLTASWNNSGGLSA